MLLAATAYNLTRLYHARPSLLSLARTGKRCELIDQEEPNAMERNFYCQ